ncbi:hypothetical protein [Nocardia salmonicida]|uniref:hypothetical protein n=1 Tax=Nocardia salmonicida TaxID=53431 RepID=UPI003CE7F75E
MTAHLPIPLAPDVLEYIRDVFEGVNENVTSRLDRMPTIHEEALDLAFIDAVAVAQGPHVTPSGTIVDIAVHFVGGGRHWRLWEVADIGFIVNFRRAGELLRTKVVLLQSKRLYPRESEFTEDEGIARFGGFGSLMAASLPAAIGNREFRFDETCRYRALKVGDQQWEAIASYEEEYELPVHYMLYHPRTIPAHARIPVIVPLVDARAQIEVGTRVLSGQAMRERTEGMATNRAPSYGTLVAVSTAEVGASLPDFVIAGILSCTEGYVVDDGIDNAGLQRVFNQRTAPISAAIRLDINLPTQQG